MRGLVGKAPYIVHYSLRSFVPQQRNRVPTLIALVGFEVHFMKILAPEEPVDGALGILVISLWELPSRPALIVAFWIRLYDRKFDDFCQTF